MSDVPTRRPKREEATNVMGLKLMGPLERSHQPSSLELKEGPGAPALYLLEQQETVVGRSQEADVSIESALISRKHVVFSKNGPEITCRDLGSANGVFLNGVKIHSALLHEGDTLQLGDVVFLFHEGK